MFGATMVALVGIAYLQNEGNQTANDTRDRIIKIERETIPCLADKRCRAVLKSVVARNEKKPISQVKLPSLEEAQEEIKQEVITGPKSASDNDESGGKPQTGSKPPHQPKNSSPPHSPKDGDGGGQGNEGGDGDQGGGGAGSQGGTGGGSESAPDSGGGNEQTGSSSGVTVAPESGVVCVEVPELAVPKVLETESLRVGC